jgi:hypothetical protein
MPELLAVRHISVSIEITRQDVYGFEEADP